MKISINQSIKKIFQVSDLHIRLFHRMDEYREVFDTFYDQLTKQNKENDGILVVCGDIVHSKNEISPELIKMVSDFFKNTANICPTFVITGNHDRITNENRLDSLTPILENIQSDRLFYLRDSGIYTLNDEIDLAIFSLIGDKSNWPTITDCESRTKIALYHGSVRNAETDLGFVIKSNSLPIEFFDGFDIVLLGDIHKRQILKEQNPVIAYPGSLIQQSHGEDISKHGWIEWNLSDFTYRFHDVPNNYGYYTLRINNKDSIPDYSDMPYNVRLRVFAENIDDVSIKKFISIIRKTNNIVELTVNKYVSKQNSDLIETQVKISDVNEVSVQNQLLSDYLAKKYPDLNDTIIDNILKLNTNMNTKLIKEYARKQLTWKPLNLEFSNLFSYGEDNKIQFEKLSGVTGIFAPNATGKTALVDVLCFVLFDKTPRTFKMQEIMRKGVNDCYAKLVLDSNNEIYTIEKKGKRNSKNEIKVDIDFYKIDENGNKISLNGKERRYTNQNIREYVGDYDDFILTALSHSSHNALFIDRGQSGRKDLLGQFMGLIVFDKLNELASSESDILESKLSDLKKIDHSKLLNDSENKLISLRTKQIELKKQFDIVNDELNKYTKQIEEKYEQKYPIDLKTDTNIERIEDFINKNNVVIETNEQILKTLEEEEQTRQYKLNELTEQLSGIDEVLMSKEFNNFTQEQIMISVLHSNIEQLNHTKNKLTQSLLHLDSHEYDPSCRFCVKNSISIIESKKNINNNLEDIINELESSNKELKIKLDYINTTKIEQEWQHFKALQKDIQNIKLEMENIRNKKYSITGIISAARIQHQSLITSKEQYFKHKEQIEKNNVLDKEIKDLEMSKKEFKQKFVVLQGELTKIEGQLVLEANNKSILLNELKLMKLYEDDYKAYDYYLKATSRDGLPYKLIKDVIPNLEVSINDILSQMVPFHLLFELDDKNVNVNLSYSEDRTWPLELASGMERFISGLAIRVALMKISNLPRSNFLIVDEGFGALDGTNIHSLDNIFNLIKLEFDWILVISHITELRDLVENIVEIHKIDNVSKIFY